MPKNNKMSFIYVILFYFYFSANFSLILND